MANLAWAAARFPAALNQKPGPATFSAALKQTPLAPSGADNPADPAVVNRNPKSGPLTTIAVEPQTEILNAPGGATVQEKGDDIFGGALFLSSASFLEASSSKRSGGDGFGGRELLLNGIATVVHARLRPSSSSPSPAAPPLGPSPSLISGDQQVPLVEDYTTTLPTAGGESKETLTTGGSDSLEKGVLEKDVGGRADSEACLE